VSALPALALLVAAATASLAAQRVATLVLLAALLTVLVARRPGRRLYLWSAGFGGVTLFLFSPFIAHTGGDLLWRGPHLPAPLGWMDVTTEELRTAGVLGLRFTALALAFGLYALALDHDRLVQGLWFARRSMLALAIALRLLPTLQRDATGLIEALRGRGVEVRGVRGHARLLGPLVGGALERSLSLAEAMEARGFGRGRRTRAPREAWRPLDWVALGGAPLLAVAGLVWL
jgi:energy-coupling factor transport system permease protein